jgi:uncharacterized protein (DUF1330 family)
VTVRLCVLLWEQPGQAKELAAFEDTVLALLPAHGGTVISRDTVTERDDGDPLEVQLLELPDEDALAAYIGDPRRAAVLGQRDAVIARTHVLRVTPTGQSQLS